MCLLYSRIQAEGQAPIWDTLLSWPREKNNGKTAQWLLELLLLVPSIILLILYWPKKVIRSRLIPRGREVYTFTRATKEYLDKKIHLPPSPFNLLLSTL